MNIARLRDEKVMREGEMVTLIYNDREYTNFEVMKNSKRLAHALERIGLKRGSKVVVQMPNCPEVIEAFWGVWRMGGVIVPVNHLLGEKEIAHIYKDSGAEVVISSAAYLTKVRAAQQDAPSVRNVILIEEEAPDGCLSYPKLLRDASEEYQTVETGPDEDAALLYTAGTTGRAKGVILTHYALYANAKAQYETLNYPDGLTNISILPLCHAYGISVMNNGLFRLRAKTVLLNTFDLETILYSIERYRANLMAAVPTMYVYMLLYPNPKKYDLSSMQYWLSGSAPLSLETWSRFKEVYGGEIIEGWGLTEAGANNASNPPDGVKKVGSIGLPMKGTDMEVIDDKGRILPAGEVGEIVLRGPSVMKGYWNLPDETTEALKGGWLHTGDVGYKDEDGYFWITDRKKDLIIKGGENISPRIIEEVLYAHPKVAEAAVVAMKDHLYGEDIRAFVVLKPGQTATEQEIIEFCKGHLKRFFLPKEVVFLEAMPKNLLGKIMKKELRNYTKQEGRREK